MSKKVIKAEVDEVITRKSKSSPSKAVQPHQGSRQQADFAEFDFSQFSQFSGFTTGAGGFPKLNWRTRMMLKSAGWLANPKLRRFLQKKWWPLWLIVGAVLAVFLLVLGAIFLIWKIIRALFSPYRDLFKRNA